MDSRIARLAGMIQKNHHLKIADGAIAATAIITGTRLLTRNIKDFKKVPDLDVEMV